MLAVGSQSAGGASPCQYICVCGSCRYRLDSLDRIGTREKHDAVGGNEEASKTAGIKTDRTKITIYALSGLGCGIGGLVMTGRSLWQTPLMGDGWSQAITAAALGGMARRRRGKHGDRD